MTNQDYNNELDNIALEAMKVLLDHPESMVTSNPAGIASAAYTIAEAMLHYRKVCVK